MSVNKCIFIGHLGKDPETRYTSDGTAITNCSIAVTEKWKDKAGAKHEKTEWVNLAFFKRLAEVAGEYLKKGSQVYVEGKLTTQKWQDKEGKDRYTTEIVVNEMTMLGSKSTGGSFEVVENKPAAASSGSSAAPAKAAPAAKGSFDNFDDDIPF